MHIYRVSYCNGKQTDYSPEYVNGLRFLDANQLDGLAGLDHVKRSQYETVFALGTVTKARTSHHVAISMDVLDAECIGRIAAKIREKERPHTMTKEKALTIQAEQVGEFAARYPSIDVASIVARVTTAHMLRDDREYETELINVHIPRGSMIAALCRAAIEDGPRVWAETRPAPITPPQPEPEQSKPVKAFHPGDTLIVPAF